MQQKLELGARLLYGKYVIEQVLGQGGFGITYKALQTDNRQQVAIKELFLQGINERNSTDNSTVVVSNQANTVTFEQQKSKFEKEARRLSSLDNEHIVKVYDFFEENQTAYYVMDYVEGQSLADLAKQGKVTEVQMNDFLDQLLSALRTIHEHHIWHLDIKPANILVTDQKRVVLIDFGASKHIEQGGSMTTSSALAYTPGFAPPEQMQGSMENFGPWTDFYALGATLYHVLTGNTPPALADVLSEGNAAFDFPQTVSTDMQRKIVWMMKPNRKERPQSVTDFYQKANNPAFLNTSQPTVARSQETVINGHQTVIGETSGKKSKLGLIIGGLVAVAAVVVLIFVLANGSSKKSDYDDEDDVYAEEEQSESYPDSVPVDEVAEEYVEPVSAPTSSILRWDGTYVAEHCPGDTQGGTGICYTTTIKLWNDGGSEDYSGTITVDGWQVGWNGKITATAFDDNTIKIWIDGTPEGMGALSDGDAVARFTYDPSTKILGAMWLGPMTEYEYVSYNTDIKKK